MPSSLKKTRPEVPIANDADLHKPIELFQNEVLRPILKLQHDILLAVFHSYRKKFTEDWDALKKNKKKAFALDLLMKNGPLKNTIVGIIIGQLEVSEIAVYLEDRKEYDRRISRMVIQRVQSTFE